MKNEYMVDIRVEVSGKCTSTKWVARPILQGYG